MDVTQPLHELRRQSEALHSSLHALLRQQMRLEGHEGLRLRQVLVTAAGAA